MTNKEIAELTAENICKDFSITPLLKLAIIREVQKSVEIVLKHVAKTHRLTKR